MGELRVGGADYEHAGPAVLRILVGAYLRLRREEQGISREDAGYRIRGSGSKISRMELGRVGLKERDVADLLTLYGVSDEAEIDTVLTLAKRASAPGWWRAFGDVVPGWFEPYLGLEQGASVIRSYETHCIPGLLQTEDYARAVIRLGHGAAPEEEIDQRVSLRMRRQEILTRPEPGRALGAPPSRYPPGPGTAAAAGSGQLALGWPPRLMVAALRRCSWRRASCHPGGRRSGPRRVPRRVSGCHERVRLMPLLEHPAMRAQQLFMV
ncbi:MAG TPA: Scr1 family TA system antitoxin-like transcriptional regulator [Streptosporangiaceae bacterium]|nr:Scr1 family TA system antitoxin-like transcriptional regulator [Streptosporangiaceae bacterium]